MMFGKSQKCAWFQHAYPAFLRRNGLVEAGLSALWREGIAVHSRTASIMAKVIDLNYDDLVKGWIEDAMYEKFLLAFMVDDYINIHTKHRPTGINPSPVSAKATLLLKQSDTAKAIPADSNKHNPNRGDSILLTKFLEEKMTTSLALTYATSMTSWI